MTINIRALAAKCIYAVIDKGYSLNDELPKQQAKIEGKDKALLQEICYGVLRFLPELENEVQQLIQKPLIGKQRVFHFLMLVGLYQIKYTRIPDHAAVSETVSATTSLKNNHLKGLINAVLRSYQRKIKHVDYAPDDSQLSDAVKFNHPGWFIKKLKTAYPEHWQDILLANQERPPMWLRVNQQHNTIDNYIAQLDKIEIYHDYIDPKSNAIKLSQAVDVNILPGFAIGHVSIQDGAAQQAARLIDCQPTDRVLDCCAAPGGKTCHMLERTPNLQSMTAIDIDEGRLDRVKENLARLNLNANVITADATNTDNWWDGQLFDRILLDAPCSGTGVIRRHPDIKWLRKATDIDKLTLLQQQILKKMWSLLKPGGSLLYATCSILPEENSKQVQHFIENNENAMLVSITENPTDIGWQILPNEYSMDGFYYAKLVKKES